MGRDVSTFGRLRTYFVIKNRQIAAVRLLNASTCQPVSSLLAMKTIESLQSCEMSNPSPPTLEDPDLVKMSEDDEIVKIKNGLKEKVGEKVENGCSSDSEMNGDETIQIDSEDSDQNEKIDSKDEESNLENGNDNSTEKEKSSEIEEDQTSPMEEEEVIEKNDKNTDKTDSNN